MNETLAETLRCYAAKYETADFLVGDPSWWMHQVDGDANQEAMAFIASCLSYGSRKQFMPKIGQLLDCACGDVDSWLRNGLFNKQFSSCDNTCFYRLYTKGRMQQLFVAYQELLDQYGTMGDFLRGSVSDGFGAVSAICRYFSEKGVSVVVPKDTQSACKRVCMFLRWMVRSQSPVDLGLWADFIDRRTLIMPLDTHVVSQSVRLGLLNSSSTSMSVAQKLTRSLAEIFPDDPLKGDFALFGYGVNTSESHEG